MYGLILSSFSCCLPILENKCSPGVFPKIRLHHGRREGGREGGRDGGRGREGLERNGGIDWKQRRWGGEKKNEEGKREEGMEGNKRWMGEEGNNALASCLSSG